MTVSVLIVWLTLHDFKVSGVGEEEVPHLRPHRLDLTNQRGAQMSHYDNDLIVELALLFYLLKYFESTIRWLCAL